MDTRILLIDDDVRILQTFARTLRLADYTVFTAENGEQGLALYQQETPDIVLLDLRMPGMDGLQVLQAMRAHDSEANVILTTGHGDKDAVIEALRAGASDFLGKPIDQVTLESALRRAEERTHLKRELRASQEALRQHNLHLEEQVKARTVQLECEIEERKRAQQTLYESKERFEKTFKSQRDAIFILSAGNPALIVDCNPAATRIFGYTRDEVVGRSTSFLHVDDAALHRFQEQLFPAIAEQGFLHLPEFQMKRKDGSPFFTTHSVMPLENAAGERTGWVSVVRDITEQKQTKAQVEHLDRVLLAIRNVDRLIVREDDRDRLIRGICHSLTDARGYHNVWIALFDEIGAFITAAESGIGEAFSPLSERLRRGELTLCGRRALACSSAVVIEDPSFTCVDCPLATKYERRKAMIVALKYGEKVYGILTVSLPGHLSVDEEEQELLRELADDIAFALHKIGAEEQLRRLNHIISTLPQPMSLVSRDYRYLTVNDAYAEYYAIDPKQILGRTIAEFCGQAVFEAEIKPYLERCLAGEVVQYEVLVDFPGRGKRWMEMRYFPYHDEAGQVTQVVSHGIDITDRK